MYQKGSQTLLQLYEGTAEIEEHQTSTFKVDFLKPNCKIKGTFDWEIWISILDFGFQISQ